MQLLYHIFADPLLENSHQKALIGGCLIAVVCGVIGCFIVLRRMAFLTDALSHAMLAGVVASFLFLRLVVGSDGAHGPALLLGALVAGLITVAMVALVTRATRVREDSAIGIMYTGIFALGAILASVNRHLIHIDLYHFVTGQVLTVNDADLWVMGIIAASVLSAVLLFYRQLQLVTFDRIMAASIGLPVLAFDYLLTTCTSFVVVGAVNMVGVVQVVGLMITPAATAYILCDRLSRMMILAATFGVSSVVGGIYLMSWTGNFPPGASIVLVSTVQFLVVLIVAPRYGMVANLLRRWRLVPEQVIEDVVGCLRREQGEEQGKGVALGAILKFVDAPARVVQHALNELQRRDWIEANQDKYHLTARGRREARRLLRAHRLWEAYLDHVGVASELLHEQAHALEHLHDEQAIDYLDDKLGHPLVDPHGSEIPEDFVHLVAGAEVKASLLRQGHRAVVMRVEHSADSTGLKPQIEISVCPRSDGGQTWNFLTAQGQEISMDHLTADAVTVRLLNDGPTPEELARNADSS